MKYFATVLCLLSIVVNTATAFSGGTLFCKHETGDSHVVSKAQHESESHVESCHSLTSESKVGHTPGESCTSCTDTEIETDASIGKASPSSERSVIKCPAVALYFIPEIPLATLPPQLIEESVSARAPPLVHAAAQQFTTTVQFRL